ncbi:PREDICTED: high mobility group protein DSP1 [Nicrophorus vespilloides]|uniref:High mobility group protein DSP1 n=1 Tax=Nicrophorus vespilloides TaxID=110193 RepID=A0ABM1NH83_NICVS|nr:PREDICTED: high mobility group protein DSP1 [Nicrophorus vespilloides]
MSEHHRGNWGGREDGMWWSGAVAADQQTLQHHQHMLHQQQLAAGQPPPQQQQPPSQAPQQQQSQQQQQQQQISTAAPTQQEQIFSYKMASSFQNPATTISNVSSTSPVGAAGIRGYDYRLGGGMAGGNPAMSAPAPAAQWWYPSAMDNSMQSNNMQQPQNNGQNNMQQPNNPNMQNMQPVHTPPPVSQSQQQANFAEAQRQEVQRQQAEAHHRQQVEAHELHRQAVEAAHRQQQANHQNQLHSQQTQGHPPVANHQLNHHQITAVHPPVPHKTRMPRGKADARPRGRMTAYAFFVQTCREEHKKKHPEENVVFAEFSKKCAERWKTMVDKEKKRFHEMAENDKKRYDLEMQHYTPPKGEKQRGKKRKQIKDPNAPKRSLSAFFWFSHDERGKVKGANPEYGVGDIAKELGRRWSDADPETKSKYEQIADKDKARYEKEMTAYKKKNNPLMVQQPAPVPEPEEEEEEEEEVEEDEDD